jgi:hypothetical protein
MLGPVSNAKNSPPDAGTLVFMQLLGILFVYGALFGEQRPRSTVRKETEIAIRVLFGCVGSYLIWSSTNGLYHLVGYALPLAILLLAAVGISALEFLSRRKYRGWRHWPRIEASVESSGVREIRTRHSHYFVAELAYSYVIGGDYYSGRFARDFRDEAAAWEYANQMRGANAMVHYHPRHPERTKAVAFL